MSVVGKEEVAAFYDKHMAPARIRVEAHESHAVGNESAHVLTLTTSFANGVVMTVHGIFTYTVDDTGLLTNLRGYWSMEDSEVVRDD